MSNNVQQIEVLPTKQSTAVTVTPMDMIDRALSSGSSPETISRLMDLQERWEKNQARKDFDTAIAAAKAEIKPIVRDAKGHNEKRYVSYGAIARVVDPILAKHGLAVRFRTEQTDRINVTCILFGHGHSEESSLSGPPDTTGNKNAIQAIGSTLTYLQRYSLVQALGLAASDDDDGSHADAGETIGADEQTTLRDIITVSGANELRFLQYMTKLCKREIGRLEDIPASHYDAARSALENFSKRAGK